MFKEFRSRFDLDGHARSGAGLWRDQLLLSAHGYEVFAEEFAGSSFSGGLYRVHDSASGPRAASSIVEMFPDFKGRVSPFAYDWLGRQFCLDFGRLDMNEPLSMLFEPGTGQALEIPATFVDFHNEEIVDYSDAALALPFFEKWSSANPEELPLNVDECVAYKVPLFLGGRDEIENLEIMDMDIYWSINAQIVRGVS